MFRKPVFWIVFVVVTALCAWYAGVNFPRAFPLVTLDLDMDREAALGAAQELAESRGWGPEGYRQAAAFDLDFLLQAFVELEAGGKQAFAAMLSDGLMSPYTWQVRNFKEFETTETLVRFTPSGEPYGFVERLPEDEPGATLETSVARQIAEDAAARDWGVNLSDFEVVEESQEVRPGGRIDHTFVYERPTLKVGDEGRYRLRMVVSGDRFTELTHFVKIPEAFQRRFEEMRSVNNGIGIGGTIAMVLLYLAGGCAVGLFVLLRDRWVLWKQPVKWAIFIALLQALMFVNQWPLSWMGYDTAVSSTNFALQQTALALAVFFGLGLVMAASFMAAESLSRKAFPNHIQLWRSWSPDVAGTRNVAGLTIAGFLLVSAFIAYEVFLYAFAYEKLGWWSPSSTLVDPNGLATYFPWFFSIAISAQAGFWEECLFRAVPLACAALLGRRFGGMKFWIIGALLVQAVIFGAGHAPYPQQPAYARVLELIVPSVGFGLLYLTFGLLPAIVLHYAFDVAMISLPLWAASSPGIWIDRTMVILLVLVPLWMVFRGRLKTGAWNEVDEEARNGAWQPPPAPEVEPAPEAAPAAAGLGSRLRLAVLVAGAVGLVVWLVAGGFSSDAPPIEVGRTDVLVAAQQELDSRGIDLDEDWRELSTVAGDVDVVDRFVWQEGGEEAYRDLIGSYMRAPEWFVRRARFEGDVAERAEEYALWFDGAGELVRFRHRLAEETPGAELSEDEARAMAHSVLQATHGLDPADLDEISAEPEQQPERRDWRLVFSDPKSYPVEQGEARVAVHVGGDEVVDSYRFVHLPEEWERAERNRATLAQIIQIVCTALTVFVFIAGGVTAIVRWSKGRFAPGTFVIFAALLLVLGVVEVANVWPAMTSTFSTAQPYSLQSSIGVAAAAIMLLATSIAIALNIGFVHRWIPAQPADSRGGSLATGAALGALVAGIVALGSGLTPATEPTWGPFMMAGSVVPLLTAALNPISSWITTATLMLLVLGCVHSVSAGWTRRKVPMAALLVIFGLVMAGSSGVDTVATWVLSGAAFGALLLAGYLVVLRFHLALIVPAAAAVAILGTLRGGALGVFPGALAGSIVAVVLVAAVAVYWFGRMTRDSAME
jgi:hypothetical protein